ncbi:MAG: DUF3667 domain-containing protein [Gemmatimonadota bacterium]
MTETGAPVTCSNCGSAQVRVYCAECGERQPTRRDFTATALAAEAASEFASVDGRLWRSVVALLTKPGFLTQEYFAGRRTRFMRPFSLFVMLNVAFFFFQPYTGLFHYTYAQYVDTDGRRAMATERRQKLHLTEVTFARRFDQKLDDQKKSILLVAIPVFAIVLTMLYARSGRTFVEHLVFSVHSYAFMVFYLLAVGTAGFVSLAWLVQLVHAPQPVLQFLYSELALMIAIGIGMVWYLKTAMRRYYGSGRAVSFARALVLFFLQGFLIATFHTALFHTVLLSL